MANRVILAGNLGADPEMRLTQNGLQVCTLRLATTSRKKNGDHWVTETDWHRVTAFNKIAENIGKYCRKGSKVLVEAHLKYNKWVDNNGQTHYQTNIIVDNVEFLSPQKSPSQTQSSSYTGQEMTEREHHNESNYDDDDIPF